MRMDAQHGGVLSSVSDRLAMQDLGKLKGSPSSQASAACTPVIMSRSQSRQQSGARTPVIADKAVRIEGTEPCGFLQSVSEKLSRSTRDPRATLVDMQAREKSKGFSRSQPPQQSAADTPLSTSPSQSRPPLGARIPVTATQPIVNKPRSIFVAAGMRISAEVSEEEGDDASVPAIDPYNVSDSDDNNNSDGGLEQFRVEQGASLVLELPSHTDDHTLNPLASPQVPPARPSTAVNRSELKENAARLLGHVGEQLKLRTSVKSDDDRNDIEYIWNDDNNDGGLEQFYTRQDVSLDELLPCCNDEQRSDTTTPLATPQVPPARPSTAVNRSDGDEQGGRASNATRLLGQVRQQLKLCTAARSDDDNDDVECIYDDSDSDGDSDSDSDSGLEYCVKQDASLVLELPSPEEDKGTLNPLASPQVPPARPSTAVNRLDAEEKGGRASQKAYLLEQVSQQLKLGDALAKLSRGNFRARVLSR